MLLWPNRRTLRGCSWLSRICRVLIWLVKMVPRYPRRSSEAWNKVLDICEDIRGGQEFEVRSVGEEGTETVVVRGP